MILMRIMVLHCLKHNVRIFGKHIRTENNVLADTLSRFQMTKFWDTIEEQEIWANETPESIPVELECMEKLWMTN